MDGEPDVYDREEAFLEQHPDKIYSHWVKRSPLFNLACHPEYPGEWECGCLSMIAQNEPYTGGGWRAQTDNLTERIRKDRRIPDSVWSIQGRLAVFKEWQRTLDKELHRTPPATHPGERI